MIESECKSIIHPFHRCQKKSKKSKSLKMSNCHTWILEKYSRYTQTSSSQSPQWASIQGKPLQVIISESPLLANLQVQLQESNSIQLVVYFYLQIILNYCRNK